jgi:hypothetical protein
MARWFAILILALSASSASATFYNGNELYELCQRDRVALYIAGYLDKSWQDRIATTYFMPESSSKNAAVKAVNKAIRGYCIPERATLGQLGDVVCKYVKENPKDRTKEAVGLINLAFLDAFPCSE